MRILVAPLNWGLGHAARVIPLVERFVSEGHEVVLGGDGESLTLLRKHFPRLRYTYLAPLNLRYSASNSQVGAILRALPSLIRWAYKDHWLLKSLLSEEHFDLVVSDNRFGLYSDRTQCIYITHQLHICLPDGWHWLEGLAQRLHARIYTRYNKVWVPDYEDETHCLAGQLSHLPPAFKQTIKVPIEYIGPLSRFANMSATTNAPTYDIVAVLSGLEPQRTLLEQSISAQYAHRSESVLIVQGLMHRPNTRIKRANITLVPYLKDAELAHALTHAKTIIARSGYSTIMDLEQLQVMYKATLIPTPGQPEQSYLAAFLAQKTQKE